MGGVSSHDEKKEKVEKLFRQNNRSSRSRSLDARSEQAVRPIGSSQSARFPHQRGAKQISEGANGNISGLTLDQKRLIEVCWFKCSQKQIRKVSEDIFHAILQADEGLLYLFRLENVPRNKLKDNEYFKSHAANLAIVLNSLVSNIQENFSQACEALRTLGAQHVNFKARGFQSLYWDIFTDCFERNCPTTFKTRFEREAWSRMILFMLAQMKLGYMNEERQQDHRLQPQRPPVK